MGERAREGKARPGQPKEQNLAGPKRSAGTTAAVPRRGPSGAKHSEMISVSGRLGLGLIPRISNLKTERNRMHSGHAQRYQMTSSNLELLN